MWSRACPERGAFTLLETQAALVVLVLLVLGLARLTVSHERLLGRVGEWLDGEPSLYLVRAQDDLERLVGVPAALAEAPGPPPDDPPAGLPRNVRVLALELTLDPPTATATVLVEEAEP